MADGLSQLANFAKATLTAGIDSSATSFNVSSGQGALFPTLSASTTPAYAVIWDGTTYTNPLDDPSHEIVSLGVRVTDAFSTVGRGKLGTSAVAHNTSGITYSVMIVTVDELFKQLAAGRGLFAGTDSGSADAYSITIYNWPTPIADGMRVAFRVATANTGGAATLTVNGFGSKSLVTPGGLNPPVGTLVVGDIVEAVYDATNGYWVIVGCQNQLAILDNRLDRVLYPKVGSGLAAAFTPVSQTFYAAFVGQARASFVVKFIDMILQANLSAVTTMEVGVFSSPLPPNRSNQTLTKIDTQTITATLTSGAVKVIKNASAMTATVNKGTYLWVGCRFNGTVSTGRFGAAGIDMAEGNVLTLASAGAMSSTGSYAATTTTGIAADVPEMRATLD